jgi:hypothetical protein
MRQNIIYNLPRTKISARLKATESFSIGATIDLAPHMGNLIQGGRVSRCRFWIKNFGSNLAR